MVRIALFGSGSPLSAAALREVARRHDVAIVIQPERRLGRRERVKRILGILPATSLAVAARELKLPTIIYVRDRFDETRRAIRQTGAELIAIASFPALLPPDLLDVPAINLHQALLPRHRGVDPLFWTYHSDDRASGTTVHWVEAGADCGDIISQRAVPLARGYPLLRLYDDLTRQGSEQLADAIDAIASGRAARLPQDPKMATHEPAPARRTWRVEFDVWPAERTWHFLHGIGATHGSICRAPSGEDMPVGPTASYSTIEHGRRPGTFERTDDRSIRLFCPDGIVTAALT
jgi:methionyl-tRNA formyltransferase